jgi:hypothetical protein
MELMKVCFTNMRLFTVNDVEDVGRVTLTVPILNIALPFASNCKNPPAVGR